MNPRPVVLASKAEHGNGPFTRSGVATSRRRLWAWARLAGGAAILVVLVARLGADPFLDALRLTSLWALVAAVAVTALTTVCCAWRWSLVAEALDVDVSLGSAIAAYYRSQFLNVTLPSGVLGDVHRALLHGRDVGQLGRGLRSVAWERALGQVVQIGLTVLVLLALPSPLRSRVPVILLVGVVLGLVVVGLTVVASRSARGWPARVARTLVDDLHRILHARRTWLGIVLASGAAAVGHVVIFLVALRTTGVTASTGRLLPLVLVIMLASVVPTNVAGWGPREGAAAWAFSTSGLSAAQGVTAAVVFGVMVLVATLPGAVVLLTGRRSWRVPKPGPSRLHRRRTKEVSRG
jgi:glycosyltransferase 2 family protein